MQTEPNAKQQIVDRIKNSTNILVTVSANPSVDSLSAALSLALMLNRLDKHATAVFSGEIPKTISFLKPDKTFEHTVDSLRDFIIALDKEKADRLRYKVEDNVVRIFITPYRTTLTQADLQFSQGDFNVELIIALGVEKREDLDNAITAHGRILHDATVVTINQDGAKSELGELDWTDPAASSLCEMLMSLSESLQSGLLDQQIATALLTGIVSATDRFRNQHTSPRVMTMAAQLMAAGANQQLIATELEAGKVTAPVPPKDGAVPLSEGKSQKVSEPPKVADGSLQITHVPVADAEPLPDDAAAALAAAEIELARNLQKAAPAAPTVSVADMQADLAAASSEVNADANKAPMTAPAEPVPTPQPQPTPEPTPASQPVPMPPVVPKAPQPEQKSKNQIKKDRRRLREEDMEEPAYSGALNATMAEAERMRREEMAAREKHHLLHHDTPGEAAEVEAKADEPTPVDASTPREDAPDDTSSPEQPVAPSNQPTVAPEVVAAPEPTPQPTTVADDEPKDERFAVPPLPPLPSEPVAAPEPSLPPAPATPPAPQPEPKAEVVTADPAQDAVELVSTPDRPFGSSSDEMLTFEETPIHTPSLADIDASTRGKAAEEAREAIDAALAAMPFNPAHKPLTGAGAVEVFDLHHAHESDASAPVSAPLAANPSLPPLPDFSTLPPLPTDTPPVPPMPVANEPDVSPQPAPTMTVPTISDIAPPLPTPPLSQPAANDPAQFRIPGQA